MSDDFVPQTELGRQLWEMAKRHREDPNVRLMSADEIAFEIAGLLPEYDSMQEEIRQLREANRELTERLEAAEKALRRVELYAADEDGDPEDLLSDIWRTASTAINAAAPVKPVAGEERA